MPTNNSCVEIPLTQGKVALVDIEDAERVAKYKWYVTNYDGKWYAGRKITWSNGDRRTLPLHRFLLNPPSSMQIDHINGDGLDNRRCNIRICTPANNAKNKKNRTDGNSQYKGVCWHIRDYKWQAYIKHNYHRMYLGYFNSETEAAKAYDTAAIRYHKEFANLNFPDAKEPK